ncbi:MAG: competence protein ComEA [Dokdonia sp.]|jgi:DNA uptake protein ComE-like DNA-binding protein
MNTFKSHFVYDKQKRSGILLFIGVILLSALGYLLYVPIVDVVLTPEEEIALRMLEHRIDSVKQIASEERKPKVFPFNPNYITDYKGYTLGMSVTEIDRLHRFRESGKWINSKNDFKKVTGVSDSLLAHIAPYFKFPDWITNPKKRAAYSKKRSWKTPEEKGMLNSISWDQLLAIETMDEESAGKILRHLQKIGGYQVDQQLYDVYGVPTKLKRAVLNEYTVKEKPTITYLYVNTATASDMATIPLLSFDLAKEIVDYRILHEGIQTLDELLKLEGMTDYKFARIRLYLKIK